LIYESFHDGSPKGAGFRKGNNFQDNKEIPGASPPDEDAD
jgi:hypothetical protein